MKTRRNWLLGMGLAASCLTLLAQPGGIPVGNWRTHFSYNQVSQVAVTPDHTYAVARGKLFSVTPDSVLSTYSTLDGFNGFDVGFIGWSSTTGTLVVAYTDGNLDFVRGTSLYNVPDFRNKTMTADKTVYNLRVNGSTALMATGVGLLQIDVDKRLIVGQYKPLLSAQPYLVQEVVYDAVMGSDSLIVATPNGLFGGDTHHNLLDPASWGNISLPSGAVPVSLVWFDHQLVMLTQDGSLYVRQGWQWKGLLQEPTAKRLQVSGDRLFLCASDKGYVFDAEWSSWLINHPVLDGASSGEQTVVIAAGDEGMLALTNNESGYLSTGEGIMPNGPSQATTWKGLVYEGDFYAVPGERWGDRNNRQGDLMRFDGVTWTSLAQRDSLPGITGLPFADIVGLAIDPDDEDRFFLSSWGEGLYEFRDQRLYKLHNQANSPLFTLLPGRFCRVDGPVFDQEGNLWVLNSNYSTRFTNDTIIRILKPDGSWTSLSYPTMPAAPTWGSILFTSHGHIWCNSVRGLAYGLFVIDRKATPWDVTDDRTRWINTLPYEDGILSPFVYNCVTEDLNGTLWIGTNEGPVLAHNPAAVFNADYRFSRVKIPRNDGTDLADYLLKDVRINCIAVDGANRKWLGTEGDGLYVLSPDGTETIHRFSSENSPLPSDYIQSITLHPETGEAFIGTSAGMVSYRAAATQGKDDYTNVRVFPNPVKPGYAGAITVTGLKENSQVRITDLNGNLLVAGTSLGGQFGWNGYNRQGKPAASGVYLVFCSAEDGSEHQVCKFMIVR